MVMHRLCGNELDSAAGSNVIEAGTSNGHEL